MSQVITVDAPNRTAKEYKAAITEMLAEITQANERMVRDKEEIDRLKVQTGESLARIGVILDRVGKNS